MNEYLDLINQDLRLTLLKLLVEVRGALNASSARRAVGPLGFNVNRDQIDAHLQWMGEAGLVEIEVLKGLVVAQITRRGRDVAAGRADVVGVSSPSEIG